MCTQIYFQGSLDPDDVIKTIGDFKGFCLSRGWQLDEILKKITSFPEDISDVLHMENDPFCLCALDYYVEDVFDFFRIEYSIEVDGTIIITYAPPAGEPFDVSSVSDLTSQIEIIT